MSWEFFVRWISIVILDLTLAGDNAVVIAMAVRSLPARQQRRGILYGAGGAVILRVAITFVAALFLQIPLLQLVGGLLLLWIAWRLLSQPPGSEAGHVKAGMGLFEAVKMIILADLVMSTDNMLAVAAASHGDVLLLLFGLGLSIPIIMCCSALVARLMGRFPSLVSVGAGILGWVAGEMLLADKLVHASIGDLPGSLPWVLPGLLAAGFLLAGHWMQGGHHTPEAHP